MMIDNTLEMEKLTERLADTQRQLEMINAMFEAAIQFAAGIFYVTDRSGKLLRWNRTLEELLGYHAADIANMHREELFVPEDVSRMEQGVEEAFVKGRSSADLTLMTKAGERIPMLVTCKRVDSSGQDIIGVAIGASAHQPDGTRSARRAMARTRISNLSEKERKVLRLVLAGELNKVIATKMEVTVRTVEKWRSRILAKTGARNATHLATIATLAEIPEVPDTIL